MDNQKLNSIINTISDKVEGSTGSWRFQIDSTVFFCITDELHNRMRIISPIENVKNITEAEKTKCLEANFHTALDARYSISDEILWAAFIHPLAELNNKQAISAISQVYSCVNTFRSSYSSGALSFPTREERNSRKN